MAKGNKAVALVPQAEVITLTISIGRIIKHPKNYKPHPPKEIAELRAALRKFGYVRRIVVQAPAEPDGYYLVAAGNGIFEALRLEGYEEIECTVVPASWTPEKVTAYLVVDNRYSEKAQKDDVQLLSLLKEIRDFDKELGRATGYSDDEFNQMLAEIAGEIEAEGTIRQVDTNPPEMAWVLVGVRLVHFGSIAPIVDQLAAVPNIILETTVSN